MDPTRRATLVLLTLATLSSHAATPATQPTGLILIQQGTLPIILSAPHGGQAPIPGVTFRQGANASKFVTVRDTDTDLLAQRLAAAIEKKFGAKPHLVVARFARKYVDPNRPAEDAYESPAAAPYYDAYHAALKKACDVVQTHYGRGILLDIHGQAAESATIFRGTAGGKSVSALTERFGKDALIGPQSVLGFLESQKSYKIFPAASAESQTEDKRFGGGYIVQTYGSHRGTHIDAIQLECGSKLRAADRSTQTAADLADALAVFAKAYLPPIPPK